MGALQLAQRCLIANGADELAMADCQDGSRQWQWQDDRLFNRQASLCLDVAGSRHKPAVPLRLAECFGGANQSFEWKRTGSMLDLLSLENLAW
ncbi:Ricin-type beta-trefoil lectin domain protein [compost metagenome]